MARQLDASRKIENVMLGRTEDLKLAFATASSYTGFTVYRNRNEINFAPQIHPCSPTYS